MLGPVSTATTGRTGPDDVESFFRRYGDALAAGDLAGISSCYAYPSYVAGDDRSVMITDPGQVEAFFAGAAENYRAAGLTRAVAALEQLTALSPALVDVDVRWSYTDDEGVEQAGERFRYLLRVGPTVAICVVTNLVDPAGGRPA